MDGLVADDQSCPLKCTGDNAKQIESNLMPCPDADVPGLGERMDGCDAPRDGDEAAILPGIGGGLSCRELGPLGHYTFKYKSANTVGAAARNLVKKAGGTAKMPGKQLPLQNGSGGLLVGLLVGLACL